MTLQTEERSRLVCGDIDDVAQACPWALVVRPVAGGYVAFESLRDYLEWAHHNYDLEVVA